MKQCIIIVINTLLLIGLVSGALKSIDKDSEKVLEKSPDKIYPKKVITLKKKPTKSPIIKSPVESFKDLPDDDLEFIKELDKQFKLHGDKIKIKVERENTTAKNSKRTVEGDLGYGYYNGQESGGGYEYPKPTFRFYPYSQHDIPASAPGYHIKDEEQSTISIIPSYSYELKQNGNGGYETKTPFTASQPDLGPNEYHQQEKGQAYAHGHGQEQGIAQAQGEGQSHGYQNNEPVIVLRIPGPTKYATHLQSLLQQYLEIRAAHYLKILEETDHQKQQQQYQQYDQVQEKPQEVRYEHQQPEEPQNYGYAEQHYPAIDDVYQSFKSREQESQQVVEQQYTQQAVHREQPQQYYYMHVDQEQPAHAHADAHAPASVHTHAPAHAHAPTPQAGQTYQTMYFYAMEPPDYEHQSVYILPQGYDERPLPITENNPRSTHTKVHFTESDNTDHSTQYPLPSIKPFERHAPTATPIHETYQADDGQAEDYQHQQTDQQYYQGSSSSPSQVISITQRPFNYHAHSMRTKSSKRNASPAPGMSHNRRRIHTQMNRQRSSDKNFSRRAKKAAV